MFALVFQNYNAELSVVNNLHRIERIEFVYKGFLLLYVPSGNFIPEGTDWLSGLLENYIYRF